MPTCSWHAVHLQFPGLLSAQRKVSILAGLPHLPGAEPVLATRYCWLLIDISHVSQYL